VRRHLISQGIDPRRLEAKGYGETRPLVKEVDAASMQKNRRVEFIIVTEEGAVEKPKPK
jgi:outer membrane protein OmpA-like peptidoglycan-associated protein